MAGRLAPWIVERVQAAVPGVPAYRVCEIVAQWNASMGTARVRQDVIEAYLAAVDSEISDADVRASWERA